VLWWTSIDRPTDTDGYAPLLRRLEGTSEPPHRFRGPLQPGGDAGDVRHPGDTGPVGSLGDHCADNASDMITNLPTQIFPPMAVAGMAPGGDDESATPGGQTLLTVIARATTAGRGLL
jgi:hypothetical protein